MPRCCSKRARARSRSVPIDAVPRRPQADRRRPPAFLCGQPRPLHGARAARRCASRGSGPSRSPASPPTDQEIAAYYNANQATYAAKETRVLSQAVVPDQADGQRDRRAGEGRRTRRGGRAGGTRTPRSPRSSDQTARGLCWRRRRQGRRGGLRGRLRRGRRADPVRLRLGRRQDRCGEARRRQVAGRRRGPRSPPSSTADKRKEAIEDLVDKVQNAIDDGSNFSRGRGGRQAAGHDDAADHRQRARRAPTRPTSCRPSSRRRSRPASRSRPTTRPRSSRCPTTRAMRWFRRPQVVPRPRPRLRSIRDQVAGRLDQRPGLAARPRRGRRRSPPRRRKGCRWRRRVKDRHRRCRRRGRSPRGASRSPKPGPGPAAAADAVHARAGQEPDGRRSAGPRLLRRQGQQDHAGQCADPARPDQPDAERAAADALSQEYAQQFVAAVRAGHEGQAQRETRSRRLKTRISVERRLSCNGRLDRRAFVAYTFPVRSIGGVTADAHRQAARIAAVHRRAPRSETACQPELRRDARGARPQVEVGRAPPDLGARGARLHPPPAQPGARAGGAEDARDATPAARVRSGRSSLPPPTTRSKSRCTAGSPPARRSRRCRAPRASPSPPPCSARASIMRWRCPAIRWSRKAFSTAISR